MLSAFAQDSTPLVRPVQRKRTTYPLVARYGFPGATTDFVTGTWQGSRTAPGWRASPPVRKTSRIECPCAGSPSSSSLGLEKSASAAVSRERRDLATRLQCCDRRSARTMDFLALLGHRSGLAEPTDISAGHCLRCGLMSDAGPSECPPTVRGRRLLGCQSLRRFSFVCSLKILVLEMGLQHKAKGFSSSPPSDRSCGSEDCSRDGNAVAPIKRVFVKSELGNPPPNPRLSRLTHFPSGRILGGDMVHLACHGIHKIRTLPETGWGAPGSP